MQVICKFFLALSFFLVLSCTDNDDKEIQTENTELAINNTNISGKWYLKGSSLNRGVFSSHQHDCSTNKDFQEFHLNGELDFTEYNSSCVVSDTETSLWNLSNGSILNVSSLPGAPFSYAYSYEIISLTSEELILKQTYNDPGGQVVEISYYTRN